MAPIDLVFKKHSYMYTTYETLFQENQESVQENIVDRYLEFSWFSWNEQGWWPWMLTLL